MFGHDDDGNERVRARACFTSAFSATQSVITIADHVAVCGEHNCVVNVSIVSSTFSPLCRSIYSCASELLLLLLLLLTTFVCLFVCCLFAHSSE